MIVKHTVSALICAALVGCAATGVQVSDEQLSAFRPGQSTEAQVLQSLGQPTMRMRLPDGSVTLIYSYAEVRLRPASLIPIVGAVAGGSDSRSSAVSLRFGADGKLIDTTTTSTSMGTGIGASSGQVSTEGTQQPRK